MLQKSFVVLCFHVKKITKGRHGFYFALREIFVEKPLCCQLYKSCIHQSQNLLSNGQAKASTTKFIALTFVLFKGFKNSLLLIFRDTYIGVSNADSLRQIFFKKLLTVKFY